MKKYLFLILLLVCIKADATLISGDTVYGTTDTVTATKLNNDNTVVKNVVNGALDNTNADTGSGFRFVEVLGSLPTVGTQGRVVFLTTDNTLNLDSGTAFEKFAAFPQGLISLWSGTIAAIPAGWELSDGSCSITCPDLTDRFIVGATQDDSGTAKTNITGALLSSGGDTSHTHGAAAGATTLTAAQSGLPSHDHSNTFNQSGTGNVGSNGNGQFGNTAATGGTGAASSHDHTISSDDHVPTFFALAYIIKI